MSGEKVPDTISPMKKQTLLISSGAVATLTIIVGASRLTYDYCPSVYTPCMDLIYDAVAVFLIFIPLFLFSLITYRMAVPVYRAWVRFAAVWIPLSMVSILMAPEYVTNMGWFYPVVKGSVAFSFSLLFVIISAAIVLWTWAKQRDMQSIQTKGGK